jgi:hypothetical protein
LAVYRWCRAQEECPVLGGLHNLALAGPFVVDAAKVENAMDNDAVELFAVVFA